MSTITLSTTPDLRLTRRGKLVIVTTVLVVLAFLGLAFGPAVVASGDSGSLQGVEMVQVTAGQTLWEIAADANPNGDIRDTIDEIVRLNSLPSTSAITPGSEIAVPVY